MRFVFPQRRRGAWPVMLLKVGVAIRGHWRGTSRADRARVQELLKRSGGRPGGLTPEERRDLLESVRALRLMELMRHVMTNIIRPGRRTRRARR